MKHKNQKPEQSQLKLAPYELSTSTKQEALLERMLVSRMNALIKLWGSGTLVRESNRIGLTFTPRHMEIMYETFIDTANESDLYYTLVIRDTITGYRVAHTQYKFAEGGEALPVSDRSSIVFSNTRDQAKVFAESLDEFCRLVNAADKMYATAIAAAKELLPREV